MENNRIIAEFMEVNTFRFGTITKYQTFNPNKEDRDYPENLDFAKDLMYNKSWDWLMPVVEKIENLNIVSFEKNLQEEGGYQVLFTKGDDIIISHYAKNSIDATYRAVIEFIKTNNVN